MNILGIDTNAKTVKGRAKGFMTAITYLAPARVSGVMNTCPNSSEGCRAACLYTSGRGRMTPIQEARVNKTKFFATERRAFMAQLHKETNAFIKKANRKGLIPCERLNGTSDIAWEKVNHEGQSMMEHFQDLQFYDYTKSTKRMMQFVNGQLHSNYHLTYSWSEDSSEDFAKEVLSLGGNVAAVYWDDFPETDFGGFEVINGDAHDLRFTDPRGKVVGLKYKKSAAGTETLGFVRDVETKNEEN
jgi:predicted DNA-binding WGR domain protein